MCFLLPVNAYAIYPEHCMKIFNGSLESSRQQEFTTKSTKSTKKNRPEQMKPFVPFVIFVVQAVALNQTWPFRITAKFLIQS